MIRQFSLAAVAISALLGGAQLRAQVGPVSLSSPDQRVSAQFAIVPDATAAGTDGKLVYSVRFQDKPVLDASGLCLGLADQAPLGIHVHIVKVTKSQGSDDYTRLIGKSSVVHDIYNSVVIDLAEGSSPRRQFSIEARAYDGGIAFRYVVPQQRALQEYRLAKENTEFRVSSDATTWSLELPNYQSSYESEYVRMPISAFGNQGGVASYILLGKPVLMHLPGTAWAAITEANLEGNSAMYLENPTGSWTGHSFITKLSPRFDNPELTVRTTLPHSSAWRVVLLSDKVGDLIESNLIADLNPPNAVKDTSWIHAGKASWNWWNGDIGPDGKSAYTTETMKYYVDFAADSGFPYMMLDAGWAAQGDITKMRGNVDVPELVRYAAAKHVQVWIWLYGGEAARQMEEAFPMYEKWGVAGVKIDFINRDDQQGIEFYYGAAKLASEHHLMVDFHGATQPWGLDRTYPNVLNYEAVLGMEQSKIGTRDSPVSRTVFPFTRMLTGPLDYTPGGFDNVTEDQYIAHDHHPMVMGTRAQQLALFVVYQAGLEMVSDVPSAYANQPEFEFIRGVPVTWDSTKVLDGYPGEYIALARRHENEWYLGSITNWTERDLKVPLSFLGKGTYNAEIYEDAADADQNPKHVLIRKQIVHEGETLSLHLAKGGGCAIRFVLMAK